MSQTEKFQYLLGIGVCYIPTCKYGCSTNEVDNRGWKKHFKHISQLLTPFCSQDLISNSPNYLPYNSYDVSLENSVMEN